MISFGIMTALLVAMACVVHYDLLGLFRIHPYRQRIVYTDNEQHQHRPTSEFDHLWIPRPGTDPTISYSLLQPIILHDHGGDGDDYWTDSDDNYYDDGTHSNREITGNRHSDDQVHRHWPAPDTEVADRVLATSTTEVPNVLDDAEDDDNDYVAPGQEWDGDIF
ncbi:uncharacterized protein LOC132921417 [Rhopalosiphum padi]|uniref:uncharacterized protein LOC132921417 n=1 Tax=Rhopalosiphum padi TaxID=40932 RepID=UPI00298DCEF6|nr:uncharacterized protein LOC132921417 [Rhopalosiphum padi]